MTTIGSFTLRDDGVYVGAIRTLSLNLKAVQIRPVTPAVERAPDHRLYVGEVECGAAWTIRPEGRPHFLSVRLDDPGLPGPLHARLLAEAEGHRLSWTRRR